MTSWDHSGKVLGIKSDNLRATVAWTPMRPRNLTNTPHETTDPLRLGICHLREEFKHVKQEASPGFWIEKLALSHEQPGFSPVRGSAASTHAFRSGLSGIMSCIGLDRYF